MSHPQQLAITLPLGGLHDYLESSLFKVPDLILAGESCNTG